MTENLENYAISMLILQEKAGLTYKEARAALIVFRENIQSFSNEFDITTKAVLNLIRRGNIKMEKAGITLNDLMQTNPMCLLMVSPKPINLNNNHKI